MKRCTKCGEARALSLFPAAPSRDGLASACKRCHADREQRRRDKNGPAIRAQRKKERDACPHKHIRAMMIRRCSSPQDPSYGRYGGRGIRVCRRWTESLENFIADMGGRPTPKHTLDRIDNDGDYSPDNCRWATRGEQARNTSRNRLLTFAGKTMCLTDWAHDAGIGLGTLKSRLKRGWSVERALTEAPRATS